jgi:hypothetical protein
MLEGRWDTEAWMALGAARLADGVFSIPINLSRQGMLTLRLVYPNGATAIGQTYVR